LFRVVPECDQLLLKCEFITQQELYRKATQQELYRKAAAVRK
jgi:hypothetical protein